MFIRHRCQDVCFYAGSVNSFRKVSARQDSNQQGMLVLSPRVPSVTSTLPHILHTWRRVSSTLLNGQDVLVGR